jgi:hypothetical protein
MKLDTSTKLLWLLAVLTMCREMHRFANRTAFTFNASTKLRTPVVHHVVVQPQPQRQQLAPNVPMVEFPRACTGQDLDLIRYQLPSALCMKKSKKLRTNQCSFSFATRCPDPKWFNEQFQAPSASSAAAVRRAVLENESKPLPALIVTIGCSNSPSLAVNTLRMVSGNPKFDVSTFEAAHGSKSSENPDSCPVRPFPLPAETNVRDNDDDATATMHCIESKTENFQQLQRTVQKLRWEKQLVVQDLNERKKVGSPLREFVIEKHSGSSWAGSTVGKNGALIDMLRIGGDEMIYRTINNEKTVLQSNVKYLEFEYNYKEGWKDHTLSETVTLLRRQGFVCFWAGSHGNLWRLTDCFLSTFDKHFWSNVACVNLGLASAAPLAARMEERFKKTMQLQHTIQYSTEKTIGTDGRVQIEDETDAVVSTTIAAPESNDDSV